MATDSPTIELINSLKPFMGTAHTSRAFVACASNREYSPVLFDYCEGARAAKKKLMALQQQQQKGVQVACVY